MSSRDPWVLRRGILWSAELSRPNNHPVKALVPAQFSRIHLDTVSQLTAAACQMDPIDPGAIVRRLDAGRECFAAWLDGSIAAYGWLTRGPEWVGEFERELQLQPGEAYIWDCATVPPHRRQRLFGALISQIAARLHEEGLHRLWIIGLNAPLPLLHGVSAAGFEPILNLTYLRLLDKRALLATSLPGASPQQILDARRVLKADQERMLGPLIVGNSARPRPPDTHFDR